MRFVASVEIMPKEGIADPQGQTVERALPSLGFPAIHEVRVGKRIELAVEAADAAAAEETITAACTRFLANPVIEDFAVRVVAAQEGARQGGARPA
ncbi:MAG: phosphoribosylformylglycinamidine synthase subunit PurS [Actinomycetota bacterium]